MLKKEDDNHKNNTKQNLLKYKYKKMNKHIQDLCFVA